MNQSGNTLQNVDWLLIIWLLLQWRHKFSWPWWKENDGLISPLVHYVRETREILRRLRNRQILKLSGLKTLSFWTKLFKKTITTAVSKILFLGDKPACSHHISTETSSSWRNLGKEPVRQNIGADCTSYHQTWSRKGVCWGKHHLREKVGAAVVKEDRTAGPKKNYVNSVAQDPVGCMSLSALFLKAGAFPCHIFHSVSLPLPHPNLHVPEQSLRTHSLSLPQGWGGKGLCIRRRKSVKNRTAQR